MNMPDLITISNGEKPRSTFAEEMESCLSKLRRIMADNNIDVVLFTFYHNINYYSDFLYCSFGRPYGLVIDETQQTSISANIDGGQPRRRTYGNNLVFTDWRRGNYFRAVQMLIGADDYHS